MFACRNEPGRLLHHLLDDLAHRLEVLFLRSPELVHTEMISGQGVFLRRLALIQTPRVLVDHEFLGSVSAMNRINRP